MYQKNCLILYWANCCNDMIEVIKDYKVRSIKRKSSMKRRNKDDKRGVYGKTFEQNKALV